MRVPTAIHGASRKSHIPLAQRRRVSNVATPVKRAISPKGYFGRSIIQIEHGALVGMSAEVTLHRPRQRTHIVSCFSSTFPACLTILFAHCTPHRHGVDANERRASMVPGPLPSAPSRLVGDRQRTRESKSQISVIGTELSNLREGA